MKIAIMQPYFFPYLGYFQLARHVDHFVFLDDVNFFKRGFINRNKILSKFGEILFTLPVQKVSQNRYIMHHHYSSEQSKFFKQVENSYAQAPFFDCVMDLIGKVFSSENWVVSEVNALTVTSVFEYVGLPFEYSFSSSLDLCDELKGEDKIIEICNFFNASQYINASGGKDLYSFEAFGKNGIKLSFLTAESREYPQFHAEFRSFLSMIDVLMFNPPAKIKALMELGCIMPPELK